MTAEEMKKLGGFKPDLDQEFDETAVTNPFLNAQVSNGNTLMQYNYPATKDWRMEGMVGAVRN